MSDKYNKKAFVVGLTGQSGSGKTLVSSYLSEQGFAVINADLIARSVTADGSECNRELRELFPSCISEQLVLDRRALADVVFCDKESLQRLNEAIFPYINAAIAEEIKRCEQQGSGIVILDAPTLFEAGADELCDMIVSVVADVGIRAERIKKRDGISQLQAEARFSSQKSVDFFITHSDVVIENNGTPQELIYKAEKVFGNIKEQLSD